MTIYFQTVLKVLSKNLKIKELKRKHITTMFSEFTGIGKISTTTHQGQARITDVVFWENANVIVALVDCPLAMQRFEFFSKMGYKYDLKYRPHITIEKNSIDTSEKYKHLIGSVINVGQEYFKPVHK